MRKKMTMIAALVAAAGLLTAQTPQDSEPVLQAETMPVFRATAVARTAKAINYRHRSGATKIDFAGTSLMPKARGEAKVESKRGYIEIEVEFDDLTPANKNGAEYLTYVLWAISPEGRTANLGEIVLKGSSSKLNVTTELQAFGLVVTAEPYFSVMRPSDLVVMENVVRADTEGKIEEIDAKYELLKRGQYAALANPLALKLDRKVPLELYQARNAVQIAKAMGADSYAAESFQKAEKSLSRAEAYQARKAGKKPVIMTARQAVQTAEDARAIAVQRQEEESLENERQAAAEREAQAKSERAAAVSETQRVTREAEASRIVALERAAKLLKENVAQVASARLEADRLAWENEAQRTAAQTESDRLKQATDSLLAANRADAERLQQELEEQRSASEAETRRVTREAETARIVAQENAESLRAENAALVAAAQAEVERLARAKDEQAASAKREADRLTRENDAQHQAAEAEALRLKEENESLLAANRAEADQLRRELDEQRASAQAELDRAAVERAQAEQEKAELRAQLLEQFNTILSTRDSARGLIVNMSDVLFDTAKYSLRSAAREKLAKVAGVISGHAGLRLEVEGHTDNVGDDDYNQSLSEKRGEAVRDYLTEQGIASDSVTTRGFGESKPIASNGSAAGRQENRRVDLVVSGAIIGEMGTPAPVTP